MNKIKAEMNRYAHQSSEGVGGEIRVAVRRLAYALLKKEWIRMVAARQVLDLEEWLLHDALRYCCDTFGDGVLPLEEIGMVLATWIHAAGYQGEIMVARRQVDDTHELCVARLEYFAPPAEEVPVEAPPSHEHPADEDPINDLD